MYREMSPVMAAQVNGFDCAECGKSVKGRVPVRFSDFGPYFCSFLCGWDYAGKNGDTRAAENAAKIRAIAAKYAK